MGAQVSITAFDGASTPVSHTLTAVGVSVDPKTSEVVALWREGIASLPLYAQITLETRSRKLPTGVYRVASTLEVPVMESVSGQNTAGYTAAPKVAYTNKYVNIAFEHERSTISEHRMTRQLAVNIHNGIATSVTPVTTGNIPELFDQLINPS